LAEQNTWASIWLKMIKNNMLGIHQVTFYNVFAAKDINVMPKDSSMTFFYGLNTRLSLLRANLKWKLRFIYISKCHLVTVRHYNIMFNLKMCPKYNGWYQECNTIKVIVLWRLYLVTFEKTMTVIGRLQKLNEF